MRKPLLFLLFALFAFLAAGCAGEDEPTDSAHDSGGAHDAGDPAADGADQDDAQRFPDVVEVDVSGEDGTYDVTVTISSPYDTPERYADGWRVTGPDGTVYGEHELAHDHQNEQPFTRTQNDVDVPTGVNEVTVEGRDSENGYGGQTRTVRLPR
ncbi:hypothetical protein [Nocardiopsis rhodophaea]